MEKISGILLFSTLNSNGFDYSKIQIKNKAWRAIEEIINIIIK